MDLPAELTNRPPRAPGHGPTATLTLDAYRRLKEELDDLTGRGRIDIAEKIRIAREHGDLRENADYDAAKNEQGLMEARIRHLEGMLRDPDIVERSAVAEEVGPGMLVTLRPLDDDDPEDETYLLAHSPEERAPGVRTITTNSPLGATIAGRRIGDEITYRAPGGEFRYEVVALEPHP